jgi:hypothetical protein
MYSGPGRRWPGRGQPRGPSAGPGADRKPACPGSAACRDLPEHPRPSVSFLTPLVPICDLWTLQDFADVLTFPATLRSIWNSSHRVVRSVCRHALHGHHRPPLRVQIPAAPQVSCPFPPSHSGTGGGHRLLLCEGGRAAHGLAVQLDMDHSFSPTSCATSRPASAPSHRCCCRSGRRPRVSRSRVPEAPSLSERCRFGCHNLKVANLNPARAAAKSVPTAATLCGHSGNMSLSCKQMFIVRRRSRGAVRAQRRLFQLLTWTQPKIDQSS